MRNLRGRQSTYAILLVGFNFGTQPLLEEEEESVICKCDTWHFAESWKPIETTIEYEFDLETTALEIKTDTAFGSDAGVETVVDFLTADDGSINRNAGQVWIKFTDPPVYSMNYCIGGNDIQFEPVRPDGIDGDTRVWRLTLTRTPSLTMTIHCNDLEVGKFQFDEDKCGSYYAATWENKVVTNIMFSHYDTGSTAYRAYTAPGTWN